MFQSSFFLPFQVERAPEEDVAVTNQDHSEDSNVPGPSPKIKKAKKGKAVPEIAGGVGAENETVPEELKLSEPSPKAKKGKKTAKVVPEKNDEAIPEESAPTNETDNAPVVEELKLSEPSPKAKKGRKNAKIVPEKKGEEEAMASENIAIPEESEADNAPVKAVPEITGEDEAENETVPEELKPSEPSPKAKKGKKKNAKIVAEEASTSDVKPAADESQSVSIPKESLLKEGEGDAENASVSEELTPPEPSPKAKKGRKNAKNAPKGKKKNVVAEEAIEDVDTNEAVSAKDPEEGAAAVEDMEVSSETVDSTTKASEDVDEKVGLFVCLFILLLSKAHLDFLKDSNT